MPPEWVQALGVVVNFSLLLVGVKLTRQFARIELKVETMWSVFVRRFGSRNGEGNEEIGD